MVPDFSKEPSAIVFKVLEFQEKLTMCYRFIIIIIIGIQPLGRSGQIIGIQPLGRSGQRPEFSQATGMALVRLHPGQILRGSLPLLSPAF